MLEQAGNFLLQLQERWGEVYGYKEGRKVVFISCIINIDYWYLIVCKIYMWFGVMESHLRPGKSCQNSARWQVHPIGRWLMSLVSSRRREPFYLICQIGWLMARADVVGPSLELIDPSTKSISNSKSLVIFSTYHHDIYASLFC